MSMKRMIIALALAGAGAVVQGVQAAEFGTAQEAQALLAKAVAAIKSQRQKTFEEINAKNPKWVDRDLYPFVLDLNGVGLAHGANARLVGKELGELKDADGKPFVREMLEQVRAKGKCQVDYKWTDPTSRKVLPKRAFCEQVGDALVGTGIYMH